MSKTVAFSLTTFGLVLVFLEVLAWLTVQVIDPDDFFDHRGGVLATLDPERLAKFAAGGGDPVLGWRNQVSVVREQEDCLGSAKTFTHRESGARHYPGFDPGNSEIIIVGDSYTYGDEANDVETYPAQLADILGVSVANHGVGGYGPVQALLQLQEKRDLYPRARIAILGIMYENVYRMVNSYRPVLYDRSSDFTLKPFMAGGELKEHPGEVAFADLERFKHYANEAFDTDFWAKPKAGFPYTIALIKAFGSNYFYLRKLQKKLRLIGWPEYTLAFQSDEIRKNLISLLDRYTKYVEAQGMLPVVVFIPRNQLDIESASRFVEDNRQHLPEDLIIGDVGQALGIDWARFNLREVEGDDFCHPSAYGYRKIAEYFGDLLSDGGLTPAARRAQDDAAGAALH